MLIGRANNGTLSAICHTAPANKLKRSSCEHTEEVRASFQRRAQRRKMRVTEVIPSGKQNDEMEAGRWRWRGVWGRRKKHIDRERERKKVPGACLFQVIGCLSFVFWICQKKTKSRLQLRAGIPRFVLRRLR